MVTLKVWMRLTTRLNFKPKLRVSYNGAFAHYTCLPCRRRGFDSLHSLKDSGSLQQDSFKFRQIVIPFNVGSIPTPATR